MRWGSDGNGAGWPPAPPSKYDDTPATEMDHGLRWRNIRSTETCPETPGEMISCYIRVGVSKTMLYSPFVFTSPPQIRCRLASDFKPNNVCEMLGEGTYVQTHAFDECLTKIYALGVYVNETDAKDE